MKKLIAGMKKYLNFLFIFLFFCLFSVNNCKAADAVDPSGKILSRVENTLLADLPIEMSKNLFTTSITTLESVKIPNETPLSITAYTPSQVPYKKEVSSSDFPLPTTPDWEMTGWEGESFGRACAADVNGDGYDDLLVGDNYARSEFYLGKAYLYYGSATGLSTTPDWTATGDQAGSGFGIMTSSLGDVNGDNYEDVMIADRRYTHGESMEGRVYVYYGSSSGLGSTANWFFELNQDTTDVGMDLQIGKGDINGDGYNDVFFTFPGYDNGQIDEGRVFGFYGSLSGLNTTPSWGVESNIADAYLGRVSVVGDVNGDNYDDLLVGGVHSGRIDLYFGSASGLKTTSDWFYEASAMGGYGGPAGDVNGDGYADFAASDYWNNTYVFYGSASGPSASPDWQAGSSGWVNTVGDINKDNYDDFFIGWPWTDSAWIYSGSTSGLNTTPSWTTKGPAGSHYGWPAGSADFNGDGNIDVYVGAHYGGPGKVFVYYGTESSKHAPTDITLSNDSVSEFLPAGTLVGFFNSIDPDITDTHTYILSSGIGDIDNAYFIIQDDMLKTNAVFNHFLKKIYSIRVRSTDSSNLFYEKRFYINITSDYKIKLTSICNGLWRVRNPNAVSKDYNWDVLFGSENGTGTVPANGEIYFNTIPGLKIVRLRLGLIQGIGVLQDIKMTNPTPCGKNAGGDIIETIFSHLGGWVSHGNWRITIPNGGVTDGSILFTQLMDSYAGPPSNLKRLLKTIEINLQLNGEFLPSLTMPIEVCLTYNTDDLAIVGGDPNRFTIGSVPSDGTEWTMLSTTVFPNTRLICATITHLSLFDIFITPLNIHAKDINNNFSDKGKPSMLPETGFPPNIITFLPEQPQENNYFNLIDPKSQEAGGKLLVEADSIQLEIPKLQLLRQIVGIPMEEGKWDLTWLYNKIGFLDGTTFPTLIGNTSLTAHVVLSDGLLGPFAKINTLQYGDVIIIHAWDKQYIYEVREKEEVNPSDLSVFKPEVYSWVTLLTCSHYDENNSVYRKRTMVRAVLINIIDE